MDVYELYPDVYESSFVTSSHGVNLHHFILVLKNSDNNNSNNNNNNNNNIDYNISQSSCSH